MAVPRKLSVSQVSPWYDKDAIERIDKVFVDGVHLPRCVFYDMDGCRARGLDENRNWLPMQNGVITVTEKPVVS